MRGPRAITMGPEGNLWVADTGNHRIQVFDSGGAPVRTIGRRGIGPGELNGPEGLAELVYGARATLMTDWATQADLDVYERSPRLAALVADALEARPEER